MNLLDFPENEQFGSWGLLFGDGYGLYEGTYSVLDGGQVEDITPERVARVDSWFAVDAGDGYADTDMAALVELADGTWGAVMAWCDTTGWDCGAGVAWKWAPTRDLAISQGLDRSARERMGLALPQGGAS